MICRLIEIIRPRHLLRIACIGLGCIACEEKNYDLDRQAQGTNDYAEVVRFQMDQDYIFWIEQFENRVPFEQIVWGCQKQDCASTRVKYADLKGYALDIPPCLVARNQTVYWADNTSVNGISYTSSSVSLPKGEVFWKQVVGQDVPSMLFHFPAGTKCVVLALDDTDLFRLDVSGTITALSLSSDPFPRLLVSNSNAYYDLANLAASGDYVYWAQDSGIHRTRKDGTAPSEVVNADASVMSMVPSGDFIYWLDGRAKALLRCNLSDCTSTTTTLAAFEMILPPRALQLSGAMLYWLGSNASGSPFRLYRCSVDGCPNGSEIVATEPMSFYAVDETDIYGVVALGDLDLWGTPSYEIRKYPK